MATSQAGSGKHKPKKPLDRFASIRIPGSKKDRPPLSHVKHTSSDWSIPSSSSLNRFEELSSKITSEKEILALFEKMMEDMNLNEEKKTPLREKDLNTKREMVIQYMASAAKTGSLRSSHQISPQEFVAELKSGVMDERLFACLDSLRVSLTSNPVRNDPVIEILFSSSLIYCLCKCNYSVKLLMVILDDWGLASCGGL
uniref:Formin GTPase-binding domain-containing protein n=1 Tax=Periophthalmus magnuspinnatus TaxID=409849 RepID=A0A3B4AQS8_9GOBI